ncbi:hypothetical protein [Rhodopseudomonas telluris]|uniref:Uncharacterized protein n=1 Tax=Rhodopseudomonas telluris TaxID=644215 RepID=A0ABV6EPJ3_9BRAD
MSDTTEQLHVAPGSERTTGRCACCGRVSRIVMGMISTAEADLASYLVHWTVGHIDTLGAEIDLIIGRWGDGASAADRVAVRLHHFIGPNGPAVMVQDPPPNRATSELAAQALLRDEVIGTPRAAEVFALYDALAVQDVRLAELFPPAQTCLSPCAHSPADRARRLLRPRDPISGRTTAGRSRGR